MDAPTTTNTTFLFHDIINSPNTQIVITVSNADGSKNSWDIYMLKTLADNARTLTKIQLVAILTRQNADTVV